MSVHGASRAGLRVLGIAVAALVAGCAGPAPATLEGAVAVTKVDRLGWNLPEESGLFRVTFDARRMQEIRREAGIDRAPEGMDANTVEEWLIEREAERELKARGLCSGSAKLGSALDTGDGKSGASGIFKCRPPVF